MQSQSINESPTIAHQIELPPQETQEPMPIGKYQPNVGKYTSPMDPMGLWDGYIPLTPNNQPSTTEVQIEALFLIPLCPEFQVHTTCPI